MKAKKAKFKIGFLPGEYEGYFTDAPGDTFNGSYQPIFSPGEIERIRNDFESLMGRQEKIETEDGIRFLRSIGWGYWEWRDVS